MTVRLNSAMPSGSTGMCTLKPSTAPELHQSRIVSATSRGVPTASRWPPSTRRTSWRGVILPSPSAPRTLSRSQRGVADLRCSETTWGRAACPGRARRIRTANGASRNRGAGLPRRRDREVLRAYGRLLRACLRRSRSGPASAGCRRGCDRARARVRSAARGKRTRRACSRALRTPDRRALRRGRCPRGGRENWGKACTRTGLRALPTTKPVAACASPCPRIAQASLALAGFDVVPEKRPDRSSTAARSAQRRTRTFLPVGKHARARRSRERAFNGGMLNMISK